MEPTILISSKNAELVVGQSWRFVRDFARRNGVRLVTIGRKRAVHAADFLAALERVQNRGKGGAL